MSMKYSLLVAGLTPTAAVSKLLASVPSFRREQGTIVAPGLLVDIVEPRPLAIEMVEDEFGFAPDVDIAFQRNCVDDPVATRTCLIQGCMALLDGHANDAVLLFNGETVVLLRRDGELVLNRIEGFWTETVQAAVTVAYEFGAIPAI